MGAARATIGDVARLAGVSPATVSRVLNRSSTVAVDKDGCVRRAVAELRYEPLGPARALRQRRTRIWTAIVADIENPVFTAVVRGLEDVAQAHGYGLVLGNSEEDPGKEAGYVDIAIRERVAGVVIAVAAPTTEPIDALRVPTSPWFRLPRGGR